MNEQTTASGPAAQQQQQPQQGLAPTEDLATREARVAAMVAILEKEQADLAALKQQQAGSGDPAAERELKCEFLPLSWSIFIGLLTIC